MSTKEEIDASKIYPNFIKNTIDNVVTTEKIDTSPDQQWLHLDIGTACFVACIIAFCLCFNYLIPDSSKIKNVAAIVAVCITFIFPLTFITSAINYPNKNTKFYILICVFIGIIFEFVTLLMTVLTNNVSENRAEDYNKNLSQDEIIKGKKYIISPVIKENNRLIYILFTTSIVLMIASISTFFYDEGTIEYEALKTGLDITPGSTMGTNIHWWMTFLYNKANQFDDWWHSVMAMIPLPAIVKVFFLFAIGFLMIFFIFVDVNLYTVKQTENPINQNDYITDKKGKPLTSLPNTSSPLMQDGILILENKNAPVINPNLQVKYLPKKFDNVYKIDYFVLLVFFTALMLSILFFTLLTFINMFLPFLNPLISIVSSIIGFALSFCLLYFYYPKENQIILLYILITFAFSLLSAPVALMVFEIFTLLFTKISISQYGNLGWYLLVLFILGILGYMLPAAFTTNLFDVNNILTGTSNNSNTIQLITVFLIAMTVGWFFGLSFHFDMFSLLFVIAFTPMKYVIKVFAPITILGLTITQIILASNSSNQQSKVTEGYQSNT